MSTKVPPLDRSFCISWCNAEFIIDTACFSFPFFPNKGSFFVCV